MKKVVITYTIPGPAIEMLKKHFDVTVNPSDKPFSKDDYKKYCAGAFGILSMLYDAVDKETIDACGPDLRIIANYAVGYNNIDTEYARSKNIAVTNTPDALTNSTAEIAFALMISVMRRIAEGDRFTRAGKFIGWRPGLLVGEELAGKTAGILGMGRIGQSFAAKCAAFGMKIIYHNRNRLPSEIEKNYDAEYVTFERLVAESDVVSIHSPLTPETKHLFTASTFARMKDGAYIINTGRGPVIKEDDLAEALISGKVAGAGLDVYEFEPTICEKLMTLENVVLLPHIGSGSSYARNLMSKMAAESIIDCALGKTIPRRVV